MNKKLLVTGLSVVLINILLLMITVKILNLSYIATMIIFTALTMFLWFLLLREDVRIKFETINVADIKKTYILLVIPITIIIMIFIAIPNMDYSRISYIMFTALFVAIYEEVLFRAIGLGSFLNSGLSPLKAVLYSSLLFAFSHLFFQEVLGVGSIYIFLNSFMMGFVLGYIYYISKNIAFVIGIHFIWDFAVFLNQRVVVNDETGLVVSLVLFGMAGLYFIRSLKNLRKIHF